MAGVDLLAVKEFLGHRDTQTTLRYSHLAPGHVKEAVNKGSLFSNRDRSKGDESENVEVFENVVRPEGVEPPTPRSVVLVGAPSSPPFMRLARRSCGQERAKSGHLSANPQPSRNLICRRPGGRWALPPPAWAMAGFPPLYASPREAPL